MNLKEIQLKHIENEYIQKCLKEGKSPSFKNINNFINKKVSNISPGFPTFQPLFVRPHECSNPEEYNHMIDNIFNDLTDLYLCDEYCNKELLSLASFYECEKNKLFNKIDKIQQKIDSLLVKKHENQQETFIETFNNYLKVDLLNTNAFVDLLTKEVKLNTTNPLSKIPLNKAKTTVKVHTKTLDNVCMSNENNCIKDSLNEIWLQKITSDSDTGAKVSLSLTLPTSTEITTIRFALHTSRTTKITATIVDEKGQQRILKTISTINTAEWNIKKTMCKHIIFTIYKPEPDGINGINFEYYFGCKNVSVFNDTYENKNIFVSKECDIQSPFNFIKLECNEILPPDTDIKYYIGFKQNNNDITWNRIYNNKINDMQILNKNTISLNSHDSYSEEDLYVLSSISHIPSPKHTKMYLGDDMWERNTSNIPDIKTDEEIDIATLKFDKIEFLNMDTIRFSQQEHQVCIYNTHVFCENSSAIPSYLNTSSNKANVKLYVNSVNISSELNVVRLAKGWNNIKIISTSFEEKTDVTINMYFGDISNNVIARKEPIKQVPLYKLKTIQKDKALNYYSVVDNKIMVKYNPLDNNVNAKLQYMYGKSHDYFEKMKVSFMAVLRNLSNDVTPKILGYKISTI